MSLPTGRGLKCESGSSRFQPGEGPSRGLLRDCTTSPINRFAALAATLPSLSPSFPWLIKSVLDTSGLVLRVISTNLLLRLPAECGQCVRSDASPTPGPGQ